MEVEEEVELTIRAELSEMATSTRAVPTENIYSITALAFDVDSKLIKVVAATLSNLQATSGTLKVKVPLRTRSIHFLANDAAGITANDLGKTPNELLKKDVDRLYYWGMASFQGNNAAEAAAALKAYAGPLTLYRNQAKVTLVGGNGDYIVGFLNYNNQGRLVPYDANGTIGYQASVQTSAGTPSPQSHTMDNNISGQQYTEYFLFEHDNEKNSALYAICYIGGKYYKVAFASSKTYFDIVRNHNYRIVTTGIDTMYGEDSFDAAEDSNYPINDKVVDVVQGMSATAEPALISNTAGTTTQVTVSIPEGLTELKINAGTAFTVTSNESLAVNANGSYNITGRTEATFTLTLKDEAAGTTGEQTINYTARAKYKEATCSTTVTLQQPTANAIVAEPVAYSLNYTTGENSVSDLLVNVTIPKDVTTLTFASDYFDAMVVGQTLALTDGAYTITHDENAESTTIPVRLRLKQDKKTDTNASFTFGSKDANVESAVIDKIDLNPVSGENVRWQGNVPLNSADYATIVPLKWEWFRTGDGFIPAGSKLNLEFTVTGDNTSWLEVFEIRGETENEWDNPKHQFAELNNSNRYTADGNGNRTLSLTLSAYTFKTILENFRSNFLGETDIAMAIRGVGITLTKVSVVEQAALPVYELWFENNNTWNGSQDYATFFTRMGDLTTNNGNQGNMNATFYDPSFTVNEVAYSGADAKKTNAMVMGENNSISFTIPDTRYLTLLVARKDNAPSIDLQKNGEDWTISSNEAKVPANYNFANGDIINKGRLIRYTLPAGTYTLQRGNNDYLLYYMRVSKDRPTMTDTELVQVQANSYVLSWSDNTKDRFHKENDTKYFVDEEAKTFTAKLNYQEWQNVNLTTTNLGISTVTWNFDNSKEESQGTRNNPEEHSYDGNETVSIEYHNAGTYTLSGTVAPNASYKYAEFYDRLPLSPVNFEVKNTIKVGLYDSWDGNAAPVSTYTDGKPLILGFKWPSSTLPIEPGQQIQFTIPDVWVRDASGSGITYDEPNNGTRTYRIGNENNRYHPRTDWTYKIEWRDVAADNISATTTTNDIYFSYNGTIGKSVTIDTPITNDNLDVALDFYADLDNNSQIDDAENRSNNRYEDLQLGTTHFYLKATISYDDSEKYDNQTVVQLQGEFPQLSNDVESGWAIHWVNSKESGNNDNNISYVDNNGLGLKFTVRKGVTDYLIEWVFETGGSYGGGEIGFTYNISKPDGQNYLLTGDTSVIIAFTNENNYTPSTPSENGVIFNCNFNDGLDGFTHQGQGSVSSNNGTLILNNGEDRANAWDAQAMYETDKIQYGATYTLSFKAKIADGTTGGLVVAIQRFVDNNTNYTYYYLGKTINDIINAAQKDDQGWAEIVFESNMNITNKDDTNNPTHFMFNFGDLVGTLYIDDLKLVKNN